MCIRDRYAEDPSKNFLPSPGKISKLITPNTNSENIRLDIGVDEGDEISFYYDPMIAKIISKSSNRTESINNMVQYLKEFEIEGINTNKSFLISVLQNKTFEEANFNTKFIENNLALFIKKKEDILPIKKHNIAISETEYSDQDVKAFEKIIAKTPKSKNGQGYTEKDLKAFDNIVSSKGKKTDTEVKTEVKNVQGKIYDTPKFLPAGDKYMLIEFGNVMNLELNFTAQNLAKAIKDNKVEGVYETSPLSLIHI